MAKETFIYYIEFGVRKSTEIIKENINCQANGEFFGIFSFSMQIEKNSTPAVRENGVNGYR